MVSTVETTPSSTTVYPAAVLLPTFSLIIIFLIFPALVQHYRNRNIGAIVLVAGVIVSLLENTMNAFIWPNDDMETWYNGVGLCDVQVKLNVFWYTAFPTSVCCILKALANVMNTDSQTWTQTAAQRRRGYIVDLVLCVGLPALEMPLHYVVQPNRYYIYGISGCTGSYDGSWLAFVLVLLPPLIWTLVDAFYSVLIMVRLFRYRLAFSTILANSNTTKSRFLRLYILCAITSIGMLPIEILTLYYNGIANPLSYSWSATHPSDGSWNAAVFVRSDGAVIYDRILWVPGGALVFFLFAFGRDAMKTYRSILLALGFGKIFPTLRPDYQRRESITATLSTIGSKAKLLFKKKDPGADSNWSSSSASDSMSPTSPKNMTFLDPIKEGQTPSALPTYQAPRNKVTGAGFLNLFKKKLQHGRRRSGDHDAFVLANMSNHPESTFVSMVTANPTSPTVKHSRGQSQGDVLVRTELTQASEPVENFPQRMYAGV